MEDPANQFTNNASPEITGNTYHRDNTLQGILTLTTPAVRPSLSSVAPIQKSSRDFRNRQGLERAAVHVGDVPEERGRRGQEGRRRGGGRRRRRRRRWRVTVLRLCVVGRTIRVYAAVMEAVHQELLLDGGLMAQLLQSQLVLPLPLRPANIRRFSFMLRMLLLCLRDAPVLSRARFVGRT